VDPMIHPADCIYINSVAKTYVLATFYE